MPRQRAIHRARVHINVAERLRHELGVRALAARARAVNGDDNRLFQIQNELIVELSNRESPQINSAISQFVRIQSANNSSCVNFRARLRIQNRRAQAVRRRRGQFLEKIRERLLHAGGIFNFYAGNFQSQNRKTHRHAMVVVGFNLRAVQRRRTNRQRIAFLDHFRAALGQFRPQRDDALGFLDTQAAKVGKIECLTLTSNGAMTIAVIILSPKSVSRNLVQRNR